MMRAAVRLATVALALAAALTAGRAAACDYPDGPPGSPEVTAEGEGIVWAAFSDATTRYAHGVLGDAIEAAGLRAMSRDAGPCELAVIHAEGPVFEDIAPRIADVTGDGRNDIVVVESDPELGAQLAVYALDERSPPRLRKIAASPHIGTRNRWLAPAGIGDLDGDGLVEIAWVDRPHLAGILRVWHFAPGGLTEVAAMPGFSNHRIGDAFITGGLRDCGDGAELILPDFGWQSVMRVRLRDGTLDAVPVARAANHATIDALLAC
jgi:hypothetical protein